MATTYIAFSPSRYYSYYCEVAYITIMVRSEVTIIAIIVRSLKYLVLQYHQKHNFL